MKLHSMIFTKNKRVLFSCCVAFLVLLCASSRRVVEPVVISINAMPGLQFDIVRFKVKPGAAVRLVFTNQDDMSHNLVITLPGTRKAVVEAAMELGEKGEQQHFIPKSSDVLWAIPVLPPGESRTIEFVTPKQEGVYPYVCTYPGHGFIMYGAMYVTNGELPPIEQDQNIEPGRRTVQKNAAVTPAVDHHHAQPISGVEATKSGHPYTPVAPYMYRVFMDDAGPAAIAVNLPHQLSYCWDAGSCRLRYAWSGEFLDLIEFWKGHKDAQAKVAGEIFYRDKSPFPLRIGSFEKIPVPKFKGYRLIKKYPEFHYELDGVPVYETLYPKEDGSGLIRKFRIAKSGKPVWLTFDPEDGVTYTTKNGAIKGNRIKLPAGEFSITMTKRKGTE